MTTAVVAALLVGQVATVVTMQMIARMTATVRAAANLGMHGDEIVVVVVVVVAVVVVVMMMTMMVMVMVMVMVVMVMI